ncbi:MAG: cell division protein SepF [Lachnospiraceae bacterium]
MANFLYKLLGMFSLTDEYDDEDEDDDGYDGYDDDDEDEAPKFRLKKSREKSRSYDDDDDDVPAAKPEKKSNNILQYNKKTNKNNGMAVCVIKPTSFEDGREISDTLLSGKAVVLNLENVDGDVAQRIIDFTVGACYSIGGNLQKAATYIFVVTPSSVDIAGDFNEQISNAVMQSSSSSSMSSGMVNQNRYRF